MIIFCYICYLYISMYIIWHNDKIVDSRILFQVKKPRTEIPLDMITLITSSSKINPFQKKHIKSVVFLYGFPNCIFPNIILFWVSGLVSFSVRWPLSQVLSRKTQLFSYSHFLIQNYETTANNVARERERTQQEERPANNVENEMMKKKPEKITRHDSVIHSSWERKWKYFIWREREKINATSVLLLLHFHHQNQLSTCTTSAVAENSSENALQQERKSPNTNISK